MTKKTSSSRRFWILVSTVAVSGISQGMLLPLIAIIFEKSGLSSSLNGIHATGLYIGILLASPFMEAPLRKFGYKPLLLTGGITVAAALALFPLWQSFWFWLALRLCIGIGDHMLHFSAQTWITSFSSDERRGRNISLYGLFFGIGFAIGPILTKFITFHESLPFMISSIISLAAWGAVWFVNNDFPEQHVQTSSFFGTFQRFGQVLKGAWVSLLPPFGYGFLEASLNGNFPVYALRNGMDVGAVALILPSFAIGSIFFQIPLGILSDRFGRRKILMTVMFLGFGCFSAAAILQNTIIGLMICFFIAGMLVGSTFSLGISYMADLLEKQLLPAGNLMCGIFFSMGSISGPFIGGLAIQFLSRESFFYVISIMLLMIFLCLLLFREKSHQHVPI